MGHRDLFAVAARRDRTHRDISPRSGRTENRPGSGRAEISSQGASPGGPLCAARRKGVLGPLPRPARLRPSAPPRPGATLTARLVAALTLGSPASGIRVPTPSPPRACAGVGGEAGAAAPPPRPSTAHRETRKGRGGEGARGDRSRPLPGGPLGPGWSAPLPSPSHPWGPHGGGSGRADRAGQGARRAGASDPRGGKLGGGGRRVPGPGRAGAAGRGGARSPAGPQPGPRDGGCRSARTRLGAGLQALGAGSAARGSRCPHPTGAAAVSAPPLVSGSRTPPAARARARAGGGVGGGPRLARPGARGPGLAPPQSDAPAEPHVALRPLGGRTPRPPAGGARTPAGPGTPRLGQPPTPTRPDTADTGTHSGAHPRRPGDAVPQAATHADTNKHWPERTRTCSPTWGPSPADTDLAPRQPG